MRRGRFLAIMMSCSLAFGAVTAPARAVDRCVLVELFTHVTCGGCEFAKAALDSLTDEYPDSTLTIIRYHPFSASPFFQQEAFNRAYFYFLGPIPMVVFDGADKLVGATADSAYIKYKAHIQERRSVPSPVIMDLAVSYDMESREGQAITQVTAVDSVICGDLRLRYALIESGLPYNGEVLHEILRDMYPADAGVGFIIHQGETYEDTVGFVLEPQWLPENCDLVVFVQCDIGKDVLQSTQRPIPVSLPPKPVQDLRITLCDPHLFLTWSPVTQDQTDAPISVDYYRVFRDTVLHSNASGKTFIDSTSVPSFLDTSSGHVGDPEVNYSYFVTAVAAGMESDPSNEVGEFDMPMRRVK